MLVQLNFGMKSLISRMESVQSPIIPVVGELIKNSPGTISLGQGVVAYSPPSEAIEFLSRFLADSTNNLYKQVEGITPLRNTLKEKLAAFNNIEINRNNCIVVTAGSNMAFMNAILAISNLNDEVILNTPYYFNHEMAIRMANCHPVLVPTDDHYQPRLDAIAGAITPKTKAIVTISPNNPTGVVYPESSLRSINKLCKDHNLYHISDEAYEYFTYNNTPHFSPCTIENTRDHTISLFSLSKSYGFASWRIGYQLIPSHLLMAMKKVQDTILICPPVISQYAAIGALQAGKNYSTKHLDSIASIRQLYLDELVKIKDIVTVSDANGAFYFFLKVKSKDDSFTFAKKLITDHRVAVIPGNTFGMETGCYLRVAYGSLTPQMAKEGIKRLVQGLKTLCK